MPERIVEKNKNDQLFNDLIALLDSKGLKWAEGEVNSGKSFVITLTSVPWYIDGHEDALASLGCMIPDLFRPFKGYNVPEMSKHRKRTHTSLSREQLISHAAALYDALLYSWMSTHWWKPIKDATESLAKSLDVYISYLKEQAKKVCDHDRSKQSPVSENTSVILLLINPIPHDSLEQINDEICIKNPYEMICVGDFVPVDRKR